MLDKSAIRSVSQAAQESFLHSETALCLVAAGRLVGQSSGDALIYSQGSSELSTYSWHQGRRKPCEYLCFAS